MININIEKKLSSFNLKVNLSHEGGVLGLLGASGSGKSLTLKSIAGLEKPDSGEIIIDGNKVYDSKNKINLPPQKRRVGFLFQNYALFPNMTVINNIKIGLDHIEAEERDRLCSEYIQRLRLDGLENHYPWQLSGGQQQRVALARALVTSPDILLLDEPFSALDHHLRHSMEKELMSILKDYKGSVIFVTHDISEAYRVCDKIVVFENGHAENPMDRDELFNSPKTYSQAVLTGCKNISPVNRIDENTVYARDWGYNYRVNDLNQDVTHIGIRAHSIKRVKVEGINTYPFVVENIVENPFDYTIYIKNPNLEEGLVSLTLDKANLDFSVGETVLIQFPTENIFSI
ncbi:MAG: ATP-binding cassette domain-containing protein [Clostridium sp.]